MKKFFVLFSSFVIVVSVLLMPLQKVSAVSTADQYCMNSNPASYESLKRNGVGSNYRQAFTPTQNRVNSVAVKVGAPPAGITGLATLRIFTAPTGTDTEVLRSDRNFTNLNAEETWYFNNFGDVAITPGTIYYISLTTSVDFLYWYSVPAGDCAPTGMAYKDGAQMGYKLHYSTFGFTEATADTGTPTDTGTSTATTSSTTAAGETLGTTSASIAKPTSLTAAYSDTEKGVKLAWKASTTADIDGYKVFRYEGDVKTPIKIASTSKDKLEYLDSDIAAGKSYSYQVRAYKVDAQSVSSNIATAAVPADAAPAKPKKLTVVDTTSNSLTVRWTKSTGSDLKGYTINLYRGKDKIRTSELSPAYNTYAFLDLDPGIIYKVELIAKSNTDKTSSPAIIFGSTDYPQVIQSIYNNAILVANLSVLIFLLLLLIRTINKKHKKL